MANLTVLGVGDICATRQSGDGLKTYGLGSCVAVIVFDPKIQCVAMDHVALPESQIDPEAAQKKPGQFADTGIPALLRALQICGSTAPVSKLKIKLVGGASVMDLGKIFNIGERNISAIREILGQLGLQSAAEDLGGRIGRTVTVDATGRVLITSPGRGQWEI